MKNILKRTLTSAAITALLVSPLAQATNGYFKIGAGAKNRGMAGAGIAYGQDAMAGAVNPAAITGVQDSVVAGAELFKPKRKGQVDATGIDTEPVNQQIGPIPGYTSAAGTNSQENSRANAFFIPSFGIKKDWSNKITMSMAVTGNGGMNTRYGDSEAANTPGGGNIYTDAFGPAVGNCGGASCPPSPPFPTQFSGFAGLLQAGGVPEGTLAPNLLNLYTDPDTTPSLGVNLAQVLITPTLAYRITPNHSIGFGPVIGYQTFRAYGLGLFKGLSSDPGNVTNNGNDDAWGVGGQIGYQGRFGMFSVGLMGRSKIYMEEFDDYSGLFAEDGDFDTPAMFGGGVAAHFGSRLTIAADVSRILYGDVDSLANDGPTADEFFGGLVGSLIGDPSLVSRPLGTDNGFGFGWDDVWVYKIGVDYAYSPQWNFRAGFNYAPVPYNDSQALFNILAPAVVEKHATVGFTYMVNPDTDFSMTYMHAFRNDVDYTYQGTGANAAFSYKAENDMYQNAIEAALSWNF
jgi:long-chain fatty acid transport protein